MSGSNMVSFALDSFVAGGAIQEGDYRIESAQTCLFDYNGKVAKAAPALKLVVVPKEGGEPQEQHYTAGDSEKFLPSEDGKGFVAVGSSTGLSKSSNIFLFVQNLVNAGWPADKLGNDFSILQGAVIHFINIPMPKRANLPKSNLMEGEQAQERDRTLPVPGSILQLPWEKAGKGPAKGTPAPAAAKGKAAPAKAEPAQEESGSDDEVAAKLTEMLTEVAEDGLDRTKARLALFRACTKAKMPPAERDGLMNAFGNDDSLNAALEPIGFRLDGSNIVAA